VFVLRNLVEELGDIGIVEYGLQGHIFLDEEDLIYEKVVKFLILNL
jgi:hypothetical protein